jgi:HTH-type transcriptional regulator/antitoxin HigA
MIKLIAQQFKNLTMAKISTEIQYEKALERVDELLREVDNQTSENDKNYIELDLLSDLVAEYEEIYSPVEKPSLPDIIRLRMAELKISQKKLATILNVSPSRISEYLNGKSEPTLKIARLLRDELKIDADIILG